MSGVLFQIKKNVKSRYKYEVCRLKRRQDILLQKKLAQLFSGKDKTRFWSEIHKTVSEVKGPFLKCRFCQTF